MNQVVLELAKKYSQLLVLQVRVYCRSDGHRGMEMPLRDSCHSLKLAEQRLTYVHRSRQKNNLILPNPSISRPFLRSSSSG